MLKLVVAIFENPTQITAFSGPVFFHYLKGTSHFTLLMYNDDEEKPKYSQLYECQTQENIKTETLASSLAMDGEDCGVCEPARNWDPVSYDDWQEPLSDSELRVQPGERAFALDICGNSFKQQGNITAHKRRHTGEKPFGCDVSRRRFAREGCLKTHMRTHTGKKNILQ